MIKELRNFVHSIYFLYLAGALIGIWFLTKWWLPGNFILAGHDSGLPLDTKQFLYSRDFAWDSSIDFGRDNAQHFGSLTIHIFDYLLSFLAGTQVAGSQLAVFFWLSLIFVSGFVLAYQFREKIGATFVFLFPVMITFNFYIGQSIFILERAKYGLFAATILFLVITFKIFERKAGILLSAIITSLILFVFNGGSWLGLPLYGGLFVVIFVWLIFLFIENWLLHSFRSLLKFLSFLAMTSFALVLLSSYSIWPYMANFISGDFEQLVNQETIGQNKDWLNSVSQGSTFLNLFRLQGVPDWFGGSSNLVNLSHIYAVSYLQDKFLVTISFLFPILAFASFLLAKSSYHKRLISFFGLLLLISMFFAAGTRSPLGLLYGFVYDHLPGFAIFRSPYYKFGGSLVIAATFLISFSMSMILERLVKVTKWPLQFTGTILVILSLGSWLGFHFIFLDQSTIFEWQKGFSTKLVVPAYVNEFKTWIDQQDLSNTKILLVPLLNDDWRNDGYDWGYWSLSTVFSSLIRSSVLTNDQNLFDGERNWVNSLYDSLQERDEERFIKLSSRIGVGFVLLRTDVISGQKWSGTNPPLEFEMILNSFRKVRKARGFGRWILYQIDQKPTEKVTTSSSFVSLPLGSSSVGREFVEGDHFTVASKNLEHLNINAFYSGFVDLYDCQSCLLEQKYSSPLLVNASIFPNSPFYNVKISRENATLKKTISPKEKADAYEGFIQRRYSEVRYMLSLGVEEQYIDENLKTINLYFDELFSLIKSFSDPDSDFFRARHTLDNFNSHQLYWRNYIGSQEFTQKSKEFQQEIFGILWRIDNIKKFYDPLLSKLDIWATQKIYYLKFSEKGEYKLSLRTDTLPTDSEGKKASPNLAVYETGGSQRMLELIPGKDGWLTASTTVEGSSEASLTLHFDNVPNSLQIEDPSLQLFPQGERACYSWKIRNFDNSRSYRFLVATTNRSQSLRLFFKNKQNEEPSKRLDNFFHGNDEVDVYPLFTYEPFRYVYYPSNKAVDPTVYLCSGDKQLPDITNMVAYEVFSPQVFVTRVVSTPLTVPVVQFDKVNSTLFTGSVKGASGPFILIFNERYSPLWILYKDDSSQSLFYKFIGRIKGDKKIDKHFQVDGYANAWLIEDSGNHKFSIEYLPQTLFELGRWVSIISLITLLLIVFYFGIIKKANFRQTFKK